MRTISALRRSLGAKLMMTRGLLQQFIAFAAQREAPFITAALALEWASKPQGVQQEWRARRLSEVRQFARYVHAVDPRHEVPASAAPALSAPASTALHLQ